MNSIIETQLAKLGIEAYLQQHHQKSLLRFLTCGSVDDGKSTLIGRLLHDSKQIYQDQLAAVHSDSLRVGTTGDKPDLALLVDGLQAEREQGITIDVAYRYFSTEKRKFIIADTPGHEQYTRNMATGASTCELAIILIDARKGILAQTRRHSFISSLLGLRHFIVAINKMDLVDYSQSIFDEICQQYLDFSKSLSQEIDISFIPLSALEGDNVVEPSLHMPWYKGLPLLSSLENVNVYQDRTRSEFRFPVQYVNRPHLDFRGFAGTIATGCIAVGEKVKVLPSGETTTIESIVTFDGNLNEAQAGLAVTLTLSDEIDISRGDLIVASSSRLTSHHRFLADVVWMNDRPLTVNHPFDIKVAGKKSRAQVDKIQYQYDINKLSHFSVTQLPLNGIGLCEWSFVEPMALDSYQDSIDNGSFIIIDRLTNATVGVAMIRQALDSESVNNKDELETTEFSSFELELNALIIKHFPHWKAQDISSFISKNQS